MYRNAVLPLFDQLRGRLPVFLFLAVLCAVQPLFAQSVGTILGTITDGTGAVIPNAEIVATRTETGTSQSTVSSAAGTFILPNLVVGTYTITAGAKGFKTGTA